MYRQGAQGPYDSAPRVTLASEFGTEDTEEASRTYW